MRGIWFVAGGAAGVYVTAKARRTAEALTVDGLHDRLTGWFAGARVLREELRVGMNEKETELRARLGAAQGELVEGRDTVRQLSGGPARVQHPDQRTNRKADS